MFTISKPIDLNVVISTSPLIRGLVKIVEYIEEHVAIGLTKSGAFNRKFVEWAAREFDWPGYSEAELYRIQKIINEHDYPPAGVIHALLSHLKFGRKSKDTYRLTAKGKKLLSDPHEIVANDLTAFLFELDHAWRLRKEERH